MKQVTAAIDLGTSKTIAFVAQKDYSGKLSVLRTESFSSKNAIRRGRVYNSNMVSEIVSELIWKLNSNLPSPIEKIYVGIGGQSLRTQSFIVKRSVEGGIVNQQLLDLLNEKANRHEPEFDENLGIASYEYYVDGQLLSDPKGTVASVIEAKYQLIVGNPYLKLNLGKIFEEKEVFVADYFISPLATAEAVLTPEEKEKGCALIEWGEGVTYVSVYKKNALKYMTTLPLGGLAITKDIRSLNVSEDEAEALKIKRGSAVSESTDNVNIPVNERQSSSRKIELRDLNWVIEARVDEIVKNIWNQIQLSGYSKALDAGIVITGGGALLRDLPVFIQNQTGQEVRLADAKRWINDAKTQLSPADSCVIGLTIMGKENCVKEVKARVRQSDMFDDDGDPGDDTDDGTRGGKKNKKQNKRPVAISDPLGVRRFREKIGKIINNGMDELFPKEEFENNENTH